jgi:hypothetical protein
LAENKISSGFVYAGDFGEIGKRRLEVIRLYLENRIELLQELSRKLKAIAENWDEPEYRKNLIEILEDICAITEDCAVCPVFTCRYSGLNTEKRW